MRTRIKICGICRAGDAAAAARAGADAIGLVLHGSSSRILTAAQANKIIDAVPAYVSVVGLFVDADEKTFYRILHDVPIQAIQLHGNESPEVVASLQPIPVIKAIHMDGKISNTLKTWRKAISQLHLTNLKSILLETAGKRPGGSGVANDWKAIRRLQKSGAFEGLPPVVAAGGLTPETVGAVVQLLRPYAVDVSSGVESGRRVKSAKLIGQFVRAVRAADESPA